jgi:hypothetical protein
VASFIATSSIEDVNHTVDSGNVTGIKRDLPTNVGVEKKRVKRSSANEVPQHRSRLSSADVSITVHTSQARFSGGGSVVHETNESAATDVATYSVEGTTQNNDTVDTVRIPETTATVRSKIIESPHVEADALIKESFVRHHTSQVMGVTNAHQHASYATTVPLWLPVPTSTSATEPVVARQRGGSSRVPKATSRLLAL